MKKVLSFILALMMVLSLFTFVNAESIITEKPNLKVFIEGKQVTFSDVPIEISGRTLLPLRALLIALGVPNDEQHIKWDEANRSVDIKMGLKEISLYQDKNISYVNEKEVELDVAPIGYKKNGRTYIPTRFVAENLGKKVAWDPNTESIYISDVSNETTASTSIDSKDTIKIGTILPISGPVSAYGIQSRDAAILAVDEINAKGGILGKKLELIVEDDECNPENTANAFKKLTETDKVTGIIGALTSKCSLAISNQAQAQKIIMVTPTATNDTVTNAGNFIFRACYNDSYQGNMVAKFANESLKAKKAAIIFDNSNDYSKNLMETFKKKFVELGGTVSAEESYMTGDKDFNAQLEKIKATNPDVLFIPDYYVTIPLIAKQVKEKGLTCPMLGADGWDEIVNNAGDEVIGGYYSNHFSLNNTDPEVQRFVKDYNARFNVKPNALAALSYDATYILAQAIQRAGSTETDKIQAEMMKTNSKFVTGNIKFDQNRNPIKSVIMLKIEKVDNRLEAVYYTTVNP